ncbi:FG-GAP repeat protein [Engelhardtia mirabilis]|uniref:FG-GAP repeat protein n=1 Tax=Engelhardtia mirabilis TaxID=2528011 RepID=A0A518BQK3_9BACT|nr:hypothetical protein Pla133_43770 [Planctomycetes bacterium Pla133]QDV03585.1 hypothetical protein Pla86_43760 [Planctomycetes bacterium Pla86]
MSLTLCSLLLAPLASLTVPQQIGPIVERTPIESPVPSGGAHFGVDLVVEGELMAVAQPEDAPGSSAGRVWIYERGADGDWALTAELVPDDPEPEQNFGDVLALSGDLLAVSAPYDDGVVGPEQGAVYLFRRGVDGTWTQEAKLRASDAKAGAFFGQAIALDGDRVVVGTPRWYIDFPDYYGKVYVFERDAGGNWSETATLGGISTFTWNFGADLALDGDRLMVGAADGSPAGFLAAGRAYLYELQPGAGGAAPSWTLEHIFVPPAGTADDFVGAAFAMDDDWVAISAPGDGGTIAFWEQQPDGTWVTDQLLAYPDGDNQFTDFGGSLEHRPGQLLVGASQADSASGVFMAGAVYLYTRDGAGDWQVAHRFEAAGLTTGDRFGQAVAFAGDRVVVGAYGTDLLPTMGWVGRVYEFDLEPLSGDVEALSLAAGGTQALELDAGYARAGDLHLVLGSLSGTAPATPIAGGLELPLVVDAYLLLTLTSPAAAPIVNPLGVLDAGGTADAAVVIPPNAPASLAGLTLHHAFVAIDPLTAQATFVSNALALQLNP